MNQDLITLSSQEQELVDLLDKHKLILRVREAVRVYVSDEETPLKEIPILVKYNKNVFGSSIFPGIINTPKEKALWHTISILLNSIGSIKNISHFHLSKWKNYQSPFSIVIDKTPEGYQRPRITGLYYQKEYFNSKAHHSGYTSGIEMAVFNNDDLKYFDHDEEFFRKSINLSVSTHNSFFFDQKIKEKDFIEDAFNHLSFLIWKGNLDFIEKRAEDSY